MAKVTGEDKRADLTRPGNVPPTESPPGKAKAGLREGGMEPAAGDPLGEAPYREGYGARAGASPAQAGAPNVVTHKRLEEPDEGRGEDERPEPAGGPDPRP